MIVRRGFIVCYYFIFSFIPEYHAFLAYLRLQLGNSVCPYRCGTACNGWNGGLSDGDPTAQTEFKWPGRRFLCGNLTAIIK